MKLKTFVIFQAALLGLLLTQGGRTVGQEKPRPTEAELKRVGGTISQYIVTGEDEYKIAVARKAGGNELWQGDVFTAQVRVVAIFALLDGTDNGVPKYDTDIANVKAGFMRWDETARNELSTNSSALREKAHKLEDQLRPLVLALDPAWKARLSQITVKITGSSTRDQVMGQVPSQGEIPPTPQTPTGTEAAKNLLHDPNSQDAQRDVENALKAAGVPPEIAHQAMLAAVRRDCDSLAKYLKAYPGDAMKALYDLFCGQAGTGGTGGAPGTGGTPGTSATGGAGGTPGAAGTGGPAGSENAGQPQYGKDVMRDPDGKVFDDREWFDAAGKLKKQIVRTTYTGERGGKIDSERILVSDYKKEADGSYTVSQNEVPDSKIDWLFTIKETKRDAAGQGTVTYQLLNAGTPKDAAFEVTSWTCEGADVRKGSAANEITVTFPKSGHYEVQAHGVTKTYTSTFKIVLSVDYSR